MAFVVGRRMLSGFAGDIARNGDRVVLPFICADNIGFGEPVVLLNDRRIARARVVNNALNGRFIGFAGRGIKHNDVHTGLASYYEGELGEVCLRGVIDVPFDGAAINVGDDVYINDSGDIDNAGIKLDNAVFHVSEAADGIVKITMTGRRI